jgi:hypothetical protein
MSQPSKHTHDDQELDGQAAIFQIAIIRF